MALNLTLTTEQKQHVKINPVTAAGKPAKLDGAPVWEVTSGPGTVVPDADGLGAFIVTPDDTDGTQTIYTVSADADLGAGVDTITDTIVLTTVHADAAVLGLTSDPAVAK
jgi:hypothetical protein